jgi:polyisoprenoid-binding protein YceI
MPKRLGHTAICLMALALALPTFADWSLDNTRSSLSFVTVKAGDVGEVHRFTELNGAVDADGSANLVINLASVDTLIPIRDERMREILFQVIDFPTATMTVKVNLSEINNLATAATIATSLSGQLTIKGRASGIAAQVRIAKLSDNEILVATTEPVIVSARAVGLSEGVEKLREIAGLPSISQTVPVSFLLLFIDD